MVSTSTKIFEKKMNLQYFGNKYLYLSLTCLLAILSGSTSKALENPCLDARKINVNRPNLNIWEDSESFLQTLRADLEQTKRVTHATLRKLQNDLKNTGHIDYLEDLAEIGVLNWTRFQTDPVTVLLRKIYIPLNKINIFADHMLENIKQSRYHAQISNLHSWLMKIKEGQDERKGIVHMMCDIHRQLPIVSQNAASFTPDDIPSRYQGQSDLTVAGIQDNSYQMLRNIHRVLDGLEGELSTVLSS